MRLVTIILATLAGLLGAVPAALAADVMAQDPARWIRVRAADGELNRVTVSRADGVVTIADAGADLLAGDGCEQVAAHEVRCSVTEGEPRVDVGLGDGHDEATALGGLEVKFDGGAGNDVLTGGDAADELAGGEGDDRLAGGQGVDRYDGGEGNDTLAARDSARESVLCGGGGDAGEADVEDDVAADCEGVARPLAPPALALPGTPVPGRTVAVAVKSGTVLARVPGGAGFAPLDPALPMPVGTVLDTTRGTVALTAAADRSGATQAADFTGGRFAVRQTGAVTLTTVLRLTGGDFASCPSATARGAVARAASRRVVRRLWGSGKGRFRTRGRTSAATVRGTVWTVTDRCDGTLTRVTRGVVVVEDLRTGRTRVLRAGQSHLVRRRAR